MNEQTNEMTVNVEAPDYQPIADAMTACCMAEATTAANALTAQTAPIMVEDLVIGQDEDGNDITIPGGMVDPRFVGAFMQQQQHAATQYQSNIQNTQYMAWLEQWESYQELQIIPYFIQMTLALAQMVEAYQCYNECLDIAKDTKQLVADELAAMQGCVAQLRDSICPHLDALGAENAARITAFDGAIDCADMMKTTALTAYEAYALSEVGGEDDRIETIHDKAFSLICQGHASAASLTIFAEDLEAYFTELLGHDVDQNVADAIKGLVDTVIECQTWLKDCADALQADYDANYGPAAATMSAAMMTEAEALVAGISDIQTFFEGCRDVMKAHWEGVHQAAEAQNIPLLAAEAGTLIPRFSMLHDDVLTCIEDHQAMQDAYTAQEECLGPDSIAEGCAALVDFATIREDLNVCADERKAQYAAAYQGKENTFATASLTEGCTALANATTWGDEMNACAEERKANYAAIYNGGETALQTAVLASAAALTPCTEELKAEMLTCAQERKAQYNATYQGKENALSTTVMTEACAFSTCMTEVKTDMLTCAAERKAQYAGTYQGKENALSVTVMTEACGFSTCMTEIKEEMLTCAAERKAQYNSAYMAKESALATTVMTEACAFSTCMTEIKTDMLNCADERKAQYNATYQGKENALSLTALQEACALAPCLADVHEWLCTQADCMDAHWIANWKNHEGMYASTLLQKGVGRHCNLDEDLEILCDEANELLAKWRSNYELAECNTHRKIIEAGERACEKHEEFYNYVCDEMQHMWDKFRAEWCPCDVRDLQELCAVWEKCHPIDELCENHECIQEAGTLMAECYKRDILPCEKRYIMEVCESLKYTPQLCEMETTALLQIRKQFDRRREQLIKGSSRWCHGATKQQLADLYRDQAAAEAAAIAAANRFEKWWEVQECDRRHRYYMDVLTNLGHRIEDSSRQWLQLDNVMLDQLLGRLHDRLLRGYEYVRNWNDSARSIMGATASAISASHESARVGQFHISRYQDMRADYNRSSLGYMSSVENTMRIGQFLPAHAAQDKNQAAQVASQAVNHGQRAIDHGHWQLDMYLRGQLGGAGIAQAGVQFGQRTVDQGQNQLQLYQQQLRDLSLIHI